MVVRACLFDWVRKKAAMLCFVLFYFVCLFVCLFVCFFFRTLQDWGHLRFALFCTNGYCLELTNGLIVVIEQEFTSFKS